MKDKDFDFDRVGKRLPYRVDEEALQRVTRNAGSIFNDAFQRDSSLEIALWEETLAEDFKYSQTGKDMPMDELIDELSDEDLMFLTEITGGTIVDQWYN